MEIDGGELILQVRYEEFHFREEVFCHAGAAVKLLITSELSSTPEEARPSCSGRRKAARHRRIVRTRWRFQERKHSWSAGLEGKLVNS